MKEQYLFRSAKQEATSSPTLRNMVVLARLKETLQTSACIKEFVLPSV